MHRAGASAREIAEALDGISHVAVVSWLKDAGLKANGGGGARSGRKRVVPNGMSGPIMDAHQQLAELASQPAPKDYGGVLKRLRKNFSLVAGLVEFQVAQAKAGTSTMTELQKAIQIQDAFAVKIRELTPKESEDPEASAEASSAAEAVVQKIMTTIDAARKNARCVHCGKNPHGVR